MILDDPSPPYPSPADIGYLAFYPLAGLGLGLLVRARAHELDWRLWMDGPIAALGTAALGAAFVFDFVADQTEGTALQVATTLAYPLGDIVLFSLSSGSSPSPAGAPAGPGRCCSPGSRRWPSPTSPTRFNPPTWGCPEGVWVEPIYLIAAVCLGAQAWQPRTDAIKAAARFDGWRELMVPALFAGVMIGLFGMQYVDTTSGLATVLWAATMVAVIVRLAISVRENKPLLEQVRTDPLTGLGSRGALQVDLEGLLRRRPRRSRSRSCSSTSTASSATTTPSATRPGTTCSPSSAGGCAVPSARRLRLPDRRRRVLRRPHLPRRPPSGSAGGRRWRSPRAEGIGGERLLGRGDDPGGGRGPARGDAARRPAHVRAEGVAPGRPR